MKKINYKPIGIIYSPFKEPQGTPIQPSAGQDIEGTVEVYPEYANEYNTYEVITSSLPSSHLVPAQEPSVAMIPIK